MRYKHLHRWDITPEGARHIQNDLRDQIIHEDRFGDVQLIAGVDLGFKQEVARASVVVLNFPELQPVDGVIAESRVQFPYIPGLLSFREIPSLLKAIEKLDTEPDLIIADGQGIAHPRRFGIASHLGLILDKPTIGCAKSRLCGKYSVPQCEAGSIAHLYDGDEIIGAAVRTRANVKEVYISIGHRVSLDSAIQLTLACCRRYRLPETTRWAHQTASGKFCIQKRNARRA